MHSQEADTLPSRPSTDVQSRSCSPPATETSRSQSEELSLGPLVGGVSKLPSNHIQCRDWRGARPHLELIAADATQHKEMGCRGVDGVGFGEGKGKGGGILAWRTKPRELFTLSDKFLLPHS